MQRIIIIIIGDTIIVDLLSICQIITVDNYITLIFIVKGNNSKIAKLSVDCGILCKFIFP